MLVMMTRGKGQRAKSVCGYIPLSDGRSFHQAIHQPITAPGLLFVLSKAFRHDLPLSLGRLMTRVSGLLMPDRGDAMRFGWLTYR